MEVILEIKTDPSNLYYYFFGKMPTIIKRENKYTRGIRKTPQESTRLA